MDPNEEELGEIKELYEVTAVSLRDLKTMLDSKNASFLAIAWQANRVMNASANLQHFASQKHTDYQNAEDSLESSQTTG